MRDRAPLIVDQPQEGYYRTRLVRDGPYVPVHIWYGPPHDPETGEVLDRSPRWQSLVNGEHRDAAETWNWCADKPIAEAEYRHMIAVKDWAVQHAPDEPEAKPYQAVSARAAAPVGPPRSNAPMENPTVSPAATTNHVAPPKISHKDFPAMLAEIMAGKVPLPNFEPVEYAAALNLMCLGWDEVTGVKSAIIPDTSHRAWGRYFLSGTQGGTSEGSGLVIVYRNEMGKAAPIVARFAICKHKVVEGAGANHSRGWHPARCSECGLDMSVDSGD